MSSSTSWKQIWEDRSGGDVPDFELDRGTSRRDQETEKLSEQELVGFIDARESETLLDAGCGTGVNILRLHLRVRMIIGIDYAQGSLERCRSKIQEHKIKNACLCLASVTDIPLPDCSVDRILCLSVLQYLDDEEVRRTLRECVRVLRPGGMIIIHVKNSSSLYWSTLRIAKQLKAFLGWTTQAYSLRSFRWYANELACLDYRIVDYNSFNLLSLDVMPKRLLCFLQRFELKHHSAVLLRIPFVRRHGAELKIKAQAADRLMQGT